MLNDPLNDLLNDVLDALARQDMEQRIQALDCMRTDPRFPFQTRMLAGRAVESADEERLDQFRHALTARKDETVSHGFSTVANIVLMIKMVQQLAAYIRVAHEDDVRAHKDAIVSGLTVLEASLSSSWKAADGRQLEFCAVVLPEHVAVEASQTKEHSQRLH